AAKSNTIGCLYPMHTLSSRNALAVIVLAVAVRGFADLDGSYILPRDHAAIQYGAAPVSDPVADLQRRLREGKLPVEYDEAHGYLQSILKALDVPVSSQVL